MNININYDFEYFNKVNIFKINFETFDYYSVTPRPFQELLNIDEKLLNKIIELTNKKVYTLAYINFINNINCKKLGLWEYHSLPNYYPEDDYKYEVHFNKPLSELKLVNDENISYIGIAEISIEFYLKNYLFFNRRNQQFLLFCDENNINSVITYISDNAKELPIEIDINYLIELANENNCIIIKIEDDEEFKEIKIIVKEDENINIYDIIIN